MKETLLFLKHQIDTQGLKQELFEHLLAEKEHGLRVLLALTGFTNESLKRLITIVRVTENKELGQLLFKDRWNVTEETQNIKEWSDKRLESMIKNNEFFRKGIVNLFFAGATVPFLSQTLPLFEFKKLSLSKLGFEFPAMIDTLVRYKEKGSYAGKAENNPELVVQALLKNLDINFEKGDLEEFFSSQSVEKRTMDFIIPNKKNPQIIIESSFLATTSSGQGDKAKTESNISKLIKQYYPQAKFIGFIDGIGWYVRQSDLKRMVSAFDEVFTFHRDELTRFTIFLQQHLQ